ncbi:hypothetical protein BL241_11575 [Ralstonia solanacearum]|uniref:Uncharacterized protein n=1 Tax=Ralstonia solanacearum TaxID=305 RepID=A0A0S4UED9_RALSL|nr:hypothetical protein BL241_11575 [Ralstonia solanacearum]CUV20554.1 protein of unknown function [Ralstonia solanacearum]
MKGVRFEEILAVLGSRVRELTPSGTCAIPMGYEIKDGGGTCTFVGDHGPGAYGPIGYADDDLRRVLAPAKAVIVASREPDPTSALVLETLLVAHVEPCTVIIRTEPEHHAAWARWTRWLSGRGPVMHISGAGVDLTDDRVPVLQMTGLPLAFKRAITGRAH